MRLGLKLLKFVAIILGIVVIVAVIASIVSGVPVMGWLTGLKNGNIGQMSAVQGEYAAIKKLDISVKSTKVVVAESNDNEKLKIETSNEYIDVWAEGETLHIVERSHGVLGLGGTGELKILVREGTEFDEAQIEVGAGMLEVEKIQAKIVKLELGAGKTEIERLIATSSAEIDGGAGLMEIKNGEINNLDLNMGAGKADLELKLTGKNKVETGVGKLDLGLIGKETNYRFIIEKKVGAVTLNGRSLENGEGVGNGATTVEINSGVGAVEIRTEE